MEPDPNTREQVIASFESYLGSPTTRDSLRRPAGEAICWREREFSVVLEGSEGPELWNGAFDRVVLQGSGGRLASAWILDFKSDRIDAEELADHAERYRTQMESYRRVLAKMTGIEESEIRTSLLFLESDTLIELA